MRHEKQQKEGINVKDYIKLSDIPFYGDFILTDGTGAILHDSRIDSGDVPPLLTIAPVVSITIEDGIFHIDIMTAWEGRK